MPMKVKWRCTKGLKMSFRKDAPHEPEILYMLLEINELIVWDRRCSESKSRCSESWQFVHLSLIVSRLLRNGHSAQRPSESGTVVIPLSPLTIDNHSPGY
jgi:hypothetical protein